MLKIAVLLALVLGIQAAQCPDGYTKASKGCFLFGKKQVTSRSNAISFCEEHNGALVEIESAKELREILKAAKTLETVMDGFLTNAFWDPEQVAFRFQGSNFIIPVPQTNSNSHVSQGDDSERTLSLVKEDFQYEAKDIELTISGIAALCKQN